MGSSFSSALAEFCNTLLPAQLTLATIEPLRSAVLDGFASMLAGVSEPVSSKVIAYLEGRGSEGKSSIIGFGRRLAFTDAVLANGTIAHACDYDDSSWTMWGHPTAPLLPALLACAENLSSSGMDLVVSFAAGLEVEKALGIVMQPEHYRRGWHPTATLGVFGAAAGAGKLLGLTTTQLQAALGIAASMTAGLKCNAGFDAKPFHAGLAARNGVEAAGLAKSGMSANPRALDGFDGFVATYGTLDRDLIDAAIARLGNPFEVIDPGLSPKLYPCCSDIHCAIDAVLDFQSAHGFASDDVRIIRCFVAPMAEPNVNRRDPQTHSEAKFSLSYCLACALLFGTVNLSQFKGDVLKDPAVRSLMERITVRSNPDLGKQGSESFSSPAIVEIELVDGRTLRTLLREMRGHPNRPLSHSQLLTKFYQCANGVLTASATANLADAISRLEDLPDIIGLMRLASGEWRPLSQ